jgi:hypothetical protein
MWSAEAVSARHGPLSLRFGPRPKGSKGVRLEYLVNGSERLESRQQGGRFVTEFQTSDLFTYDSLLTGPTSLWIRCHR